MQQPYHAIEKDSILRILLTNIKFFHQSSSHGKVYAGNISAVAKVANINFELAHAICMEMVEDGNLLGGPMFNGDEDFTIRVTPPGRLLYQEQGGYAALEKAQIAKQQKLNAEQEDEKKRNLRKERKADFNMVVTLILAAFTTYLTYQSTQNSNKTESLQRQLDSLQKLVPSSGLGAPSSEPVPLIDSTATDTSSHQGK